MSFKGQRQERRIYIVTGTPGVGKSSISKMLASILGARLVSIGELVKREGLYTGWDKERETLIADTDRLSERISEIIDAERRTIIIEGHYAIHVVPPEKVDLIFVLRRDPRDLKKTLEDRGYSRRKIIENLAAEILDVCLFDAVDVCGVEKLCEIDTTSKSPEEVVDEMISIIKGERKPEVGIVDWLEMLESKGILDDYLKEL
ncbi:adenylate kinase family protein [Candidatus Bathyarchaeota archaeon]|nr:adenylate kinase family protein [Candidatus Bathyarchaeota archaeon]